MLLVRVRPLSTSPVVWTSAFRLHFPSTGCHRPGQLLVPLNFGNSHLSPSSRLQLKFSAYVILLNLTAFRPFICLEWVALTQFFILAASHSTNFQPVFLLSGIRVATQFPSSVLSN